MNFLGGVKLLAIDPRGSYYMITVYQWYNSKMYFIFFTDYVGGAKIEIGPLYSVYMIFLIRGQITTCSFITHIPKIYPSFESIPESKAFLRTFVTFTL